MTGHGMTRILILEDSRDSLRAVTAMAEKVSKGVSGVPVNSLEEVRAALNEAQQPFQAFLQGHSLHQSSAKRRVLRACKGGNESAVSVNKAAYGKAAEGTLFAGA